MLYRRINDLQKLCHSQLRLITKSHLVELTYQRFNTVEANLFVEFIDELLIVNWHIGVSISQIVENVAEVGPISVDKVPAILVCGHIVSSRKHDGQHRRWITAQSVNRGLKVLATD